MNIYVPQSYVGWDIGGAHLKWACADSSGQLIEVQQLACPLWQGLTQFREILTTIVAQFKDTPVVHHVTMTGELADLFPNREAGVQTLAKEFCAIVGSNNVKFYGGRAGYLKLNEVLEQAFVVASANWLATASHIAKISESGVLIDIGSTTTDIVVIQDHCPVFRGYTDGERLRYEELIYSGVIRTPIMSFIRRVPFDGEWQMLTSEYFANMADVYRLTSDFDTSILNSLQASSADHRDWELSSCTTRLARMIGRDFDCADLDDWIALSAFIKQEQLMLINQSLYRLGSRSAEISKLPLIGAGVGRFLVREIARINGRKYLDFSEFLTGSDEVKSFGAICAPAAALASMTIL